MSPAAHVNPTPHGVGAQRPFAVLQVSAAPQDVLVQRGAHTVPGPPQMQGPLGDGAQTFPESQPPSGVHSCGACMHVPQPGET
jgi:hypothetical protein